MSEETLEMLMLVADKKEKPFYWYLVLVFSVTWRSRSDDGDWVSESLLVDRLHWCDSGDWGFLSWVLFFVWVCTSLYEFYMTNFSFFYKFNFEELFYFIQLNWFVLCHPRYIFGWEVVMSQNICWLVTFRLWRCFNFRFDCVHVQNVLLLGGGATLGSAIGPQPAPSALVWHRS